MKTITLVNNKGGVSKTTSTISIGAILSQNYKVALIDFDTQKNLSLNIKNYGGSDLATVLRKKQMAFEDFATTDNPNLFVLPNNADVSVQLFSYFKVQDQPYLLQDVLETLDNNTFDFILIDTPPNLEIQTTNALIASDYVVTPSTIETNSIIGLQNTTNVIKEIQNRISKKLVYLGAFISQYDERFTTTNEWLKDVIEIIGGEDKLLKSKIRTGNNYTKQQRQMITILEDKTDKKGLHDYTLLTNEILEKIKR
jgi:chromosome partitioning protein